MTIYVLNIVTADQGGEHMFLDITDEQAALLNGRLRGLYEGGVIEMFTLSKSKVARYEQVSGMVEELEGFLPGRN